MKRQRQNIRFGKLARSGIAGLLLLAVHASSAGAEQTPPKRCAPVAKQEYDAARRQNLLRSRAGDYVRTGGIGRRQYWYCHAQRVSRPERAFAGYFVPAGSVFLLAPPGSAFALSW